MNIVLIGYRASGKSTVGKILSRELGWNFVDIDREIESRAGANISEAYKALGETAYRDLESQVVADACAADRRVVAMGAGSIVRPQNQASAMQNSLVVYLELTAEESWKRISADPQSNATRPNLAGGGLAEVVEMLGRRVSIYKRCASVHLDATLAPDELARQILNEISQGDQRMIRNRLRRDLAEKGFTIGSWLNLASPIAAEIMAMAGYSWLAVDAEHAPIGIGDIANHIRAIESRGATAIARVPNHQADTIGQALDAGALGIVAPHVRTADQARQIADACRFRPRGSRSSGTTRAATFGAEYLKWFNDEVVVMAQIEEREGVDNAEEIARVDGIDVMFLGPNDLSSEMGLKRDDPAVEEAMRRVLAAAKKAGKPAGIPVSSVEAIRKWRSEGFTVLTLSSDFRLLENAAAAQLRAAMEK